LKDNKITKEKLEYLERELHLDLSKYKILYIILYDETINKIEFKMQSSTNKK
jgi:hypothetical protein